MQQLINAIVRNRNFFIYLLLLFISIFFLQNKSPYHQSVIHKMGLTVSGSLLSLRNNYQNYFHLTEENKRLVLENVKLKTLLTQQSTRDSIAPLDIASENLIQIIPARVVKNSIAGVRNFIILDKGTRDSVATEMGVISKDGIVGVIEQTNEGYSSVISVLHRDLQINAKLKKSNAFGSMFWPGESPNKMRLIDIPTINPVNVGDTIVTGGMSAYFPKGIPIGKVSRFEVLPSKRYYDIEVILFTNFSTLDHVYVVNNKDKVLIDELVK